MRRYNVKPKYVDLKTFNKYLKDSETQPTIYYDPRDNGNEEISGFRYIWEDVKSNEHLMFKLVDAKKRKIIHVALDLNDLEAREDKSRDGWTCFRKYLKPLITKSKEKIALENNDDYLDFTTEQFQWCDLNKADTWMKCYSYDINSCFLSFLNYPLPGNEIIRRDDIVKDGEIGFYDDAGYLVLVSKGKYAHYIFKKVEYKCLQAFAHKMYGLKAKASTEEEKELIKEGIVKSIGYLKYVNVFLRSAILNYARIRIKKYIDSDTVYCNTDSIISTKKRDDIEIGDGLGQFKVEHANQYFIFRSIGISVWYGERIKYRGQKRSTIFENKNEYYIYEQEKVMLDIDKNKMIRINAKGAKERLWQKPNLNGKQKQANLESAITPDTTPNGMA